MELNAEDGGNRQSISVQLPEKLEENSEAYKAGYRTIADITRARIEKVIAKLKAEHPEKTEGLACAHFTLAPSNFKVWNSELNDPGAIRQQLDALQNTEKHADEQTAMLTELLLKNGLGAWAFTPSASRAPWPAALPCTGCYAKTTATCGSALNPMLMPCVTRFLTPTLPK